MSDVSLASLGWDADLAAALHALGRPDLAPARVVAVHRGRVALSAGGQDPSRLAPVAGAWLHRGGPPPVVGDWVALPEGGAVEAVLPRRGVIARAGEVLAAHVDLVLVATAAGHDLNLRRAERYLAIAASGGVPALVLLTKGDLATDPVGDAVRVGAALGTEVLPLSTADGWGLQALRARLQPGRTAILLGSSGVGKSTLTNALLGREQQRTLAVREDDDRGRHATTHRELFVLPDGALLLDTPGLRAPGLADADGLDVAFAAIADLAVRCRFPDCAHGTEPGCAVQAAVAEGTLDPARLHALGKLKREARRQEELTDGVGRAARRARERATQRHHRAVQGSKHRRL